MQKNTCKISVSSTFRKYTQNVPKLDSCRFYFSEHLYDSQEFHSTRSKNERKTKIRGILRFVGTIHPVEEPLKVNEYTHAYAS